MNETLKRQKSISSQAASISAWCAVFDWPSIVAAFKVARHGPASSSAARRNTAARSSHGVRDQSCHAADDASIACCTCVASPFDTCASTWSLSCGATASNFVPTVTSLPPITNGISSAARESSATLTRTSSRSRLPGAYSFTGSLRGSGGRKTSVGAHSARLYGGRGDSGVRALRGGRLGRRRALGRRRPCRLARAAPARPACASRSALPPGEARTPRKTLASGSAPARDEFVSKVITRLLDTSPGATTRLPTCGSTCASSRRSSADARRLSAASGAARPSRTATSPRSPEARARRARRGHSARETASASSFRVIASSPQEASAATDRSGPSTSAGCWRSRTSLSDELRDELAHVPVTDECDRLAELSGLFHSAGRLHLRGRGEVTLHLDVATSAVARRAFGLLRSFGVPSEIRTYEQRAFARPTRYQLHVEGRDETLRLLRAAGTVGMRGEPLERPPRRVVARACCRRAYLRGALLGGGSLSGPRAPHLEIRTAGLAGALFLAGIAERDRLRLSVLDRGRHAVAYAKGAEAIADVLVAAGAHDAVLALEERGVLGATKAHANRLANADHANLVRVRAHPTAPHARSSVSLRTAARDAVAASARGGRPPSAAPVAVAARARDEVPAADHQGGPARTAAQGRRPRSFVTHTSSGCDRRCAAPAGSPYLPGGSTLVRRRIQTPSVAAVLSVARGWKDRPRSLPPGPPSLSRARGARSSREVPCTSRDRRTQTRLRRACNWRLSDRGCFGNACCGAAEPRLLRGVL